MIQVQVYQSALHANDAIQKDLSDWGICYLSNISFYVPFPAEKAIDCPGKPSGIVKAYWENNSHLKKRVLAERTQLEFGFHLYAKITTEPGELSPAYDYVTVIIDPVKRTDLFDRLWIIEKLLRRLADAGQGAEENTYNLSMPINGVYGVFIVCVL